MNNLQNILNTSHLETNRVMASAECLQVRRLAISKLEEDTEDAAL